MIIIQYTNVKIFAAQANQHMLHENNPIYNELHIHAQTQITTIEM